MKADPDEYNNLYENPEYKALINRMKKRLDGLVEKYDDDSDMSEKPQEWQDKVRGLSAK